MKLNNYSITKAVFFPSLYHLTSQVSLNTQFHISRDASFSFTPVFIVYPLFFLLLRYYFSVFFLSLIEVQFLSFFFYDLMPLLFSLLCIKNLLLLLLLLIFFFFFFFFFFCFSFLFSFFTISFFYLTQNFLVFFLRFLFFFPSFLFNFSFFLFSFFLV